MWYQLTNLRRRISLAVNLSYYLIHKTEVTMLNTICILALTELFTKLAKKKIL